MVASCVAFNCTNRSKKDSGISFFGFPLGNPLLLKRWILAIKRDGFRPSKNSRICSKHFTPESFQLRPGASYPLLRQDAIPSLFDFSKKSNEKLGKSKKKVTTKKKLLRELKDEFPSDDEMKPIESNVIEPVNASRIVDADHCYDGPKFDDASVDDCKTKKELVSALTEHSKRLKEELSKKRLLLRKKVRTLQQQIRRRDKTVRRLKGTIQEMEEEQQAHTRDCLSVLRTNLDYIPSEIFENELKNSLVEKEARRYSDTVKEFAITLYVQSSAAYEYMRTIFTLPSPSLIKRWTSSQSQLRKSNVSLKHFEVVEVVTQAEYEKAISSAEIIEAVGSVECPNDHGDAGYAQGLCNVQYVNGAENGECAETVNDIEFFEATDDNMQVYHPIEAVSNMDLEEAIRNVQFVKAAGQNIGFEIVSGFLEEPQ